MAGYPLIDDTRTCWKVAHADRFAFIVDAADYFRAVKRAVIAAKRQVLMIGWDFDTRIELERGRKTIEGPNRLGEFLDWMLEKRPEVDLKILKWNLGITESLKRGETPIVFLEWMAKREMDIKLDGAHPAGASHHQKIIVVDDRIAFCGGIDITKGRWDTPEHLDRNPLRHSADGDLLGPWHDATTCVDGELARALGELGRNRWKRATGEDIAVPEIDEDPWPDGVEPNFHDVDVAISRTIGEFEDQQQVTEIETLVLDIVRTAEKMLYIESQYFASRTIAEAIAERMEEADGPEIVVINPQSQDGWLEEKTMGAARAKLLKLVGKSDRRKRFRLYYPVTVEREPIYVHAKIMVADDRLIKIGSANLNNRSMGFDTECDLTIEADESDGALCSRIERKRNSLLCEHLGVDRETLEARLADTGSLIETIEAFRSKGRGLELLDIRDVDGIDETLGENDLLDPERPGGTMMDMMKNALGMTG